MLSRTLFYINSFVSDSVPRVRTAKNCHVMHASA
jgi:hypothetical protein